MRKLVLMTAGVLIFICGCFVFSGAAVSKTTWRTVESRMPQAVSTANLHVLQASTDGPEGIALPLGLRVRQFFIPPPPPPWGLQDCILNYTLAAAQPGRRLHCRVRFTRTGLARIVVEYPKSVRHEATALRDALRQTFPKDRISMRESPDT